MSETIQRLSSVALAGPEPRWTLDSRVRHLNHGSFGAVPVAVQEEQQRLRSLMDRNPVRWFASLTDRIADARHQMAALLAVDPAKLAFVYNASAGASVVFQMLMDQGPVDVLVTNHGYGAVTMGAQRLAQRTGGQVRTSQIPIEATAAEAFAILDADLRQFRPKLLVVDQITSPTARAFSVDDICRRARELGVLTLVDGAHSPGVLVDPVCREADYWIGNLHKFACSARGAAVIVTRGALRPQRHDGRHRLDHRALRLAAHRRDGRLGERTRRVRPSHGRSLRSGRRRPRGHGRRPSARRRSAGRPDAAAATTRRVGQGPPRCRRPTRAFQ